MSGPWSDLERPPLSERALRAALTRPGEFWTDVRVVTETGSTNDDLAAAARTGQEEGTVLVAEAQSSGRGRLDRTWVSPPRAGLTFSVLLRPVGVPVARWAWLPLLAGLSVRSAVATFTGLDVALKWPNDVLADGHKLAGVLSVVVGDAAVIGIGLNVSNHAAELPRPDATSLVLAGAEHTDRDPILRAVLRRLAADYLAWRVTGGDPAGSGLRAAYREACDTVGRPVSAALPDGRTVRGTASDVDADGRLVLATDGGEQAVAAGDVVHLR